MKSRLALVVAALSIVACGQAARAADAPPFSDPLCTDAAKPVTAYNVLTKDPNTTLDAAIAGAQSIVDAYNQCAAEALRDGSTPKLQYAHLSAAQYMYVIGGWQHLGGNDDLARSQWEASLKLAQDIIDWQPMSQTYYSSNDVNVGSDSEHNPHGNGRSQYLGAATAVHDADQKALAGIGHPVAPKSATPATSATPAPAPAASPHIS